jgi:hypothetical protein
MKKMLFATLMGLSVCSVYASVPSYDNQAVLESCEFDCYEPYTSTCTYSSIPECCNSPWGISVDVDFLWWTTHAESALSTITFNDTNTFENSYDKYAFDYQWKPGYRIELGYVTCLGGYEVDLFAKWTWFRTNCKQTLDALAPAGVLAQISNSFMTISANGGINPDTILTSDLSISFLYERLDLGFMSNSFQVGYFTFKPSAAVTFAYLQDTFRGLMERDLNPSTITCSSTSKFSGVGVTVGANVTYPLMQNAFLYSETELSALWGEMKLNSVRTNLTPSVDPNLRTTIYSQKFWTGRVIVAQELGIGYSTCVWSMPMSTHVGWQFLYLPNFNMLTDAATFYNRTVNGLVAGVVVGF